MAADGAKTGEILSMFIFEVESMLRSFEGVLAAAQSAGSFTPQQLNELFRVMHTLKGSSAMMGFDKMRASAHTVEDMLSVCRDMNGDIPVKRLSQTLYKAVTAYGEAMERLSSSGSLPDGFDELNAEANGFVAEYKKAEAREDKNDAEAISPTAVDINTGITRFRVRLKPTQLPCIRALVILKALSKKCDFLASDPPDPGKHPEYAEAIEKDGFAVSFKPKDGAGEESIKSLILAQVDVSSCEREEEKKDTQPHGAKLVSVDQNKLSRQIELLGELSTAHSILEKLLEKTGGENVERLLSQSRKYIDTISETALRMNMVTAETLFLRLRMLARDMSAKLGKNVEVILEGGDEPIERNMVEALYDPLMHMIRNCLDHGIESPKERAEKGKPQNGRIIVSIVNRRSDVVISVCDDGRGIDPEMILDKAIDKGIAKADHEYTNDEIMDILLKPGFTTNDGITQFSGRGVGLDVVDMSVRQMSGTLSVKSDIGAGTTFTITLPATLSMIEVVRVEAGDGVYIIPTSAVKRLYGSFDMPDDSVVQNGPDKWKFIPKDASECPLVDLRRALARKKSEAIDRNGAFLTLRARSGDIAIRADKIDDIVTVVVKPLPDIIRRQPQSEALYTGCTVMPDGKMALVIDVNKLDPEGRDGIT